MKYISKVISIGDLLMGGNQPVRLQSMTNTDTMDTEATVAQAIRMIEAGSELVRVTAPGIREAENLREIKKKLQSSGYRVPLIADIHFNPKAAEIAATIVEKVRINPGNYTGKQKITYSDAEYSQELEVVTANLKPLIEVCKNHGTAIRIGVNHGSLGTRIVERFGDTVEGMVVSALEFTRICHDLNFHNLVISVKSSNSVMMLQAYRKLAKRLLEENLNYPLHLGVTEAGDGLQGRMKSIAGIGAVLASGIGDTIRVSLTEDPEFELPVAAEIVKRFPRNTHHNYYAQDYSYPIKGDREVIGGYPGKHDPVALIIKTANNYILCSNDGQHKILSGSSFLIIDKIPLEDTLSEVIESIREHKAEAFILKLPSSKCREFINQLRLSGCKKPVILMSNAEITSAEELMVENCIHPGTMLMDGYGQGLCIEADPLPNLRTLSKQEVINTSGQSNSEFYQLIELGFGVLQATRARITSTDYISCPSCGRTHFNIQQRLQEVKAATARFTGLKIAVMGCIVNGPGEMADADYGYVGAGKGKVTLYKGKQIVKQNVPEDLAVDELLKIILSNNEYI